MNSVPQLTSESAVSSSRDAQLSNSRECRQARGFYRLLAVLLAGVQTFAVRNSITPDGMSYLDLARAYGRHDWAMIVNGYWGPFYAWLLALVLGICKPSIRWEYPVVHIMNFIVFLFAMAAFEFFWATALRYRETRAFNARYPASRLSDFQLWIFGYALFLWLTVGNILYLINPDLCLAALVFVATGLLIRLKLATQNRALLYVLFGLVLGLGYLVKAVMFPMGFIFLAVAFLLNKSKKHRRRIVLSVAVFLVVCAPQILALSISERHFTFSDTGKLAFLWYNYDLPLRNWQGQPPNSGIALHPTRRLWIHPSVFEFNGPVRATYPLWYNPGYWNAGMAHPLQLGLVARRTLSRIARILSAFTQPRAWLVGMLFVLFAADFRTTTRELLGHWYLIIPPLAIFAMYSLTWVDQRYLAVWELVLWACLLLSVRNRSRLAAATHAYNSLAVLVALALISAVAYGSYGQIVHGRRDDARPEYVTAEGLLSLGLHSGDRVAAIGFNNDVHWAHLARLSVVAEINSNDACEFWRAPSSLQTRILQKIASADVKAVVANLGGGVSSTSEAVVRDLRNCAGSHPGWQNIPGSPNIALMLR